MDLAFIRKKGRREIRVGCRKNRRCRGAVMKGRDMRSYVSRSVTDEQAFKNVRDYLNKKLRQKFSKDYRQDYGKSCGFYNRSDGG